MSTRTGSRASSRSSQQQPPGPRWLRWIFTVAALVIAFTAIRQQVVAQTAPPKPIEQCEDYTDGRPCTLTEELWFCIENAIEAYDDCKEDANVFGKIVCTAMYEIDFWACYLDAPIEKFK